MIIAHIASPLSASLLAIVMGVIIGLGIAAVMSARMHRDDQYRLRLLRQTVRRTAEVARAGCAGHVDRTAALRGVEYRMRVALDDDDRIRARQ